MIISNSEVDIFNTCERKWWYGFAQGIRSKYASEALSYGVLGHRALESYYKALKEGESWADARAAGMAEVSQYMGNGLTTGDYKDDVDIATVVGQRFMLYTEKYRNDGWRILEVEKTFKTSSLAEGIEYAMTCDLLVEETKGPFTGEVIPVDHKWCYNFWLDIEIELHPQLPKYIKTLRDNGYPVKRGMLNEIRYRANAKKLFERAPVNPNEEAIRQIQEEEARAAKLIEYYTRQGVAASGTLVRRKMQRTVCRNCPYNLVCKMELYGEDPTRVMVSNFEPNTYGYRR